MLIKSLVDTSLLQDSGWVGAKLCCQDLDDDDAVDGADDDDGTSALSGDGDQDVVETDIVNVVPLFRDMCHGANEPPN